MPSARVHDGEVVDLQIHGSGPDILIPLFEQTRDDALVETLSDRYRVVMFRYPGKPKPHTLTPANVVADLLAIAEAAGADRFAWCGYSWTAVIGLQLALRTDRLTALICGGWPPVCGPYKEMLSLASGREWQQHVTFYRELQGFDDKAAQPSITCPRLCFAGSADDVGGPGIGPTMVTQRENLERLGWDVRILEGLDHMEPLQPEIFVPLVSEWLDRALIAGLERERN